MNFIESNYFYFLNFKDLKNETQNLLDDFCNFYLDNYKGSNKDNLESLSLFFNKFLKDNQKDSIFLSVFNNSLNINIYDFNIDFLAINECLKSLKTFINEFKDYLKEF